LTKTDKNFFILLCYY